MRIRCNYCGGVGNVPDDLLLRKVRCSRCNYSFVITLHNVLRKHGRRKAKRVPVSNVTVDFGFARGISSVTDISRAGIGIEPTDLDYDFEVGETVIFDVYDNERLVFSGIEAKVARVQQSVTGCEFSPLDLRDKHRMKAYLTHKNLEANRNKVEDVKEELDTESLEYKLKDILYKR